MALTLRSTGDNFHRAWNTVTRKPLGSWTTPAVGDLVTLDSTLDNGVDIIAGIEGIYGIVESTNNNSGVLSITELVPGCTIELPYTGVVARGDKVVLGSVTQGTSLARTTVQTDNTNGLGTVIAVDAGAPHGTGHCVVRF